MRKILAVLMTLALAMGACAAFAEDYAIATDTAFRPFEWTDETGTLVLKHSFIGGVGLRQVCDWCRLLYSFKDEIDASLLQERLTKMGLMREWKTFAALAVRHLGMNAAYIPLYDPSPKWDRNADIMNNYIILDGNFGHNWDRQSRKYYLQNLYIGIKTFCYHSLRHFVISPGNSLSALLTSIGDLFLRFRNKVKRTFAKKQ